MSSRTLLNLALFCLAGLLALIVVYRPGIEPEPVPQTLTALSADGISRIEVTRAAREPLHFTRQAGDWVLAGSSELPASNFQIHALLALLQAQATRSYPADSLDLEALGLNPPQATLLLDDISFNIGITDAVDKLRYVQTGNTVFLVTDRYQHLINADWSSFVERRLLPASASLSRLQLPEFTLSLAADRQWQLYPADPAVSTEALQSLVSSWEQATAYYVRRHQGNADTGTITLEFSDKEKPVTLHIMAHSPELILARPELGIQYHLQSNMAQTLLALPVNKQETDTLSVTPLSQ
jgi:hypothetical protein